MGAETSGLWADRSFKFIALLYDLYLQGVSFDLFGGLPFLIKTSRRCASLSNVFKGQIHFGLLIDTLRLLYFSGEVIDDLLAVRNGDIIHSVLGNFGDIVTDAF